MKVRDLIEKLSKCDEDAMIVVHTRDYCGDVKEVHDVDQRHATITRSRVELHISSVSKLVVLLY
jgi:hypothetical protein